jgi:23S rRNA (uracil1939-C5)-methyltransferase/tRNA (uracil-5-)-methyltransferase
LSGEGLSVEKIVRPIVPSPRVYHYRNRLDLKLLRRKNGQVHIGFSAAPGAPVLDVSACPIAMERISGYLPLLRREAEEKLPPDYRLANLTVRCGDGDAVRWGGIGRRSLKLPEEDHFYTDILGRRIYYSLDTFFQANLSILPELARALRGLPVWNRTGLFCDLYGGVGLFGHLVADLVGRVVNIEENIHAVAVARRNIRENDMAAMEVFSGRVEGLLGRVLGEHAGADNIVMVDPPRAGLSAEAIKLLDGIKGARYLLYLSCNPGKLAENIAVLNRGQWEPVFLQPFDFFPRTRHLETLALFTSRG